MRYYLILILLCFSCGRSTTTKFQGIAMKMPYRIVIGERLSKNDKHIVDSIITSTFAKADRIFNHWNQYSELSFLNGYTDSEPHAISSTLFELFQIADQIVSLSDSRYDPTLAPIIACWKAALSQDKTPTKSHLLSQKVNVGWENISFEDGKFLKSSSGVRFDFDSIAKGYAVDLLIKELTEAGFPNVLVEWAGEIAVRGTHATKRPWLVEIYSPNHKPHKMIELEDAAVATSGNYLQYWAIQGENHRTHIYSHLINKETLMPIELQQHRTLSVTVKAPTCALADGLATAAMLFESNDDLAAWIKQVKKEIPEVTFWVTGRQEL